MASVERSPNFPARYFAITSTFALMEHNILAMYEKSRTTKLSQEEAAWLEGVVSQYPYFPLPYQMLARHHQELETLTASEALLRAAGMSPSRAMLKRYLLDTTSLRSPAPPKQEPKVAEMPALEEKTEVVEPKVEQPISAEMVTPPVEEVAPLTPAAETPVEEPKAEEKAAPEEVAPPVVAPPAKEAPPVAQPLAAINWGLHTRISIRTYQYVRLSEKILNQIKQNEGLLRTSEVATLQATPPVIVDEEVPQIEVETPSMTVVEEVEESPSTETAVEFKAPEEISQPKEEEVPVLTVVEEAPEPQAKEEAVVAELIEPQVIEEEVVESAPQELVTEETQLSPEMEVIAEAPSDDDELPPLDEEETSLIRPLEFTSQGLGLSRKLTNFSSNSEETLDESALTANYKIGAFSSFSFLDAEAPELVSTAEVGKESKQVSLAQSHSQQGTEIVVRESGRIVEIQVTPEQLELLFDPQRKPSTLPAQEEEAIEASAPEKPAEPAKKPADEIIERFIETEPSISRPDKQRTTGDDLAKHSVQEPEDAVTETLAWIHARQGNTQKAIKMYEKLKLRFPQKSDYFADLISKLKK
jgi:hypothetical protein